MLVAELVQEDASSMLVTLTPGDLAQILSGNMIETDASEIRLAISFAESDEQAEVKFLKAVEELKGKFPGMTAEKTRRFVNGEEVEEH